MKSSLKSSVLVGAALLAAALVGTAVADEPAKDTLQGSWNDYPAKWISDPVNAGSLSENSGFLDTSAGTQPPATLIPPADIPLDEPPATVRPPILPPERPPIRPPIQQQQGSFDWGGGKTGGGFNWGGGKTGGGFNWGGGKTGGGSSWGKTRPPQSQQGTYPNPGGGQGNPDQARLLEYIRALQQQNAELRALLERLAAQQGMNGGRSPDLPSEGIPLQ